MNKEFKLSFANNEVFMFDFQHDPELFDFIHNKHLGFFDASLQHWVFKSDKYTARILRNKLVELNYNKLEIDRCFNDWVYHAINLGGLLHTSYEPTNYRFLDNPEPNQLYLPANTKFTPYPHQTEAAKALLKNKKFLLADEMGAGKSLSAIYAAYNTNPSNPKTIIVCPASVKLNWRKELIVFGIDFNDILVVKSANDVNRIPEYNWVIINYDILNNIYDDDKPKRPILSFKTAIFDEAHYCKTVDKKGNPKSKRGKFSLMISKYMENVYLLTGTPITNHNSDIYLLCKMIDVNFDWSGFASRFCGAYTDRFGWHYDRSTNNQELHRILSRYTLRRKTEDVVTLPGMIRSYIPLDVNLTEYKRQLKLCLQSYKQCTASQALMMFTAMRKTIADSKIKGTIDFILSLRESNQPVVVFTCFKSVLDGIVKAFPEDATYIDGSVSAENRQKAIEEFQNGTYNIMVCNIQAAGVGITLTRAHVLVFNDYAWLPADMEQAAYRIYRVGQKTKCNIFYMYAEQCGVDEDLTNRLNTKLHNIGIAVDGKPDRLITVEEERESDYFIKFLQGIDK